MPRIARLWIITFLGVVLFTGCVPTPVLPPAAGLTPEADPDATAYPTSPAGPLPEIAISDLVVQAGENKGEWWILGMATNDSPAALETVRLRVELANAEGTPTSEATVSLPLSILQPQASSPFAARLHQPGTPAGAHASLESFLFSSAEAIPLRVGPIHTTRVPDGVFVRGTVLASERVPVRVHDVVVAWRDEDRALAGLALATVAGASVPPGGAAPWIAFAPGAGPDSLFQVFTAAGIVAPPSESPISVVDGPTWRVTSQGQGFATGAVRNDGQVAVFPQVAIAAYVDGTPISLQVLESGIPLQPGETLTFAADQLPGLRAALEAEHIDMAELTLEAYLDGQPVPPDVGAPILLPVSIRQFEVIGSSAFVRGFVSRPASVSLESAAVFVSLRSTAGEPLSARWLELDPPPSDAGSEFSLDIPLPAGVDAAMCEYDVRALGLPPPDSSG
jgi:hypothetical protein